MKILYVIDPGVIGGAAAAFLEIVKQMTYRGVECFVCVCSENEYNDAIRAAGGLPIMTGHAPVMEPISPYRWKRPIKYPIRWLQYRYRRWKALCIIAKSVDMSTIDLVHTNSARNDLGCYINKKYATPHIVHIREFGSLDFDCITLNRHCIRNLNLFSTCFIAISNAVRNHWVKRGLDPAKVIVIYNGVHSDDIGISTGKNKEVEDLRMVISGGICAAKGQILIVEALGKLPAEIRSHITVDIIGWNDSNYLRMIENLMYKYGLENNIKIIGPVDDVHKRLKQYQIGLTCSRSEGFGRVTAEYMHAQLGVIASDSGANPELIEDKTNGLLFKSGDSDSLAEKIFMFYNDRELLKTCGFRAKEKADEEYTDDINGQKIFQLYEKIANHGKGLSKRLI